jgi:hypothetical protein
MSPDTPAQPVCATSEQHRFRAQSGDGIATIVALALQAKIQGDQQRAKHALHMSAFDTGLIQDNADRANTPRMKLG